MMGVGAPSGALSSHCKRTHQAATSATNPRHRYQQPYEVIQHALLVPRYCRRYMEQSRWTM